MNGAEFTGAMLARVDQDQLGIVLRLDLELSIRR